jgi:hypothetical protein
LLGENRDVFFPKLNEDLHLITFSDIARRYLVEHGYEPYECDSEDEARGRCEELIKQGKWPCYFFRSDTTGEKGFEEFFTDKEVLDLDRFNSLGVIKNEAWFDSTRLDAFTRGIEAIRERGGWKKDDFLKVFRDVLPDFAHEEKGKNLNSRM